MTVLACDKAGQVWICKEELADDMRVEPWPLTWSNNLRLKMFALLDE